jgi:Carboxypeptidase regulatory-like domain
LSKVNGASRAAHRNVAGKLIRLLAAGLLLTCVPSTSQPVYREVSGVVTDKSHNPLPGSFVQLENTGTLTVRSYITKKDGSYIFHELNDDVDYKLTARYRNYWSPAVTISRLNALRHPEITLVIPID